MSHDNEDFDNILASIMQGSNATPKPQSYRKPVSSQPLNLKPQPSQPIKAPKPVHELPLRADTFQPRSTPKSAKKRGKAKWRLKPAFIYCTLVFLGVIIGSFFIFYAVTLPKDPFDKELADKVEYPLLYPGKLPTGFTIDTGSIKQPEDNVVIYAIRSNSDVAINVSLQPQPQGLNLKPLLDTMSDVREIKAPAGKTYVGINEEGRLVSQTVTGSVWVIMNVPRDDISTADFDALINSFREG